MERNRSQAIDNATTTSLKRNNKELTLIAEGIKKRVEYEAGLIQEEEKKDEKIVNSIIESIKDLKEASIMLRKDIEILKVKNTTEEVATEEVATEE